MKITPLRKIVHTHNVGIVKVGSEKEIPVPSPMYEAVKEWFVKGEFEIRPDLKAGVYELHCLRLEKDIQVSINRPTINGEKLAAPETAEGMEIKKDSPEAILKAEADKIFHVRLLHKPSMQVSNTQALKRSQIPLFIDALIQKFPKGAPDSDFAVIRVSMEDKTIDVDSI